ncbi:MAG TPA: carboxypeptidase regulatory-like domain-containing protein [Candidatus Limnocylindrales bacterium]|nr:carboxypeptidase regulatory-like domain-containing protein [Candidatus Limnocylindrales bacterium]
MRPVHIFFVTILFSGAAFALPAATKVSGKVTLNGSPAKPKPLDLSKEPACAKMHAANPLFPESLVLGPGNAVRNVVVYISAGAPYPGPVPSTAAVFDQEGCHYTTHVLAFRVGQEVKISNSDPLSHNIHPLAKVNREWNKIQPPGTPAFAYSYENEEFIPVKCNLHPWMQGYFIVLRTPFFSVTGDDGDFTLPELPAGHYTISAWHETLGTQSQEIDIKPGGDPQSLNFTFTAKP